MLNSKIRNIPYYKNGKTLRKIQKVFHFNINYNLLEQSAFRHSGFNFL